MSVKALLFDRTTGILRAGWRIPYLLLWVAPLFAGLGFLSRGVHPHLSGGGLLLFQAAMGLGLILGALGLYRLFGRVVEHRDGFPELTLDGDTPRHLGLGFLLGGGPMLVIVAILALAGCYRVDAVRGPLQLVTSLVAYVPQSFSEDFVFCLILFRLLKAGLGRKAALLVAPVLFCLVHVGNPNESPLGLMEIFTGGVLMYYAYDRTGSFYTVWGLHFSWNFTMNGVFGLANSGHDVPGFLQARVTGPAWLTGGATGPEASVLALASDVLLFLLLWKASDRCLRARVG